jgi:hypothetical protein
MKKSSFKPPYKKNGRTTFGNSINGKSGAYLIKKNGKIVYIGYSASNLYKTIYRHFQSWTDPTQRRVTYQNELKNNSFTVRVILCTPKQAQRLEKYLILKYLPEDNELKIDLFSETKQEQRAAKKVVNDYFGTPVDNVPF